MLPTDKVELTFGKNDDWREGNTYTVKHINTRHPNVIQIQDSEGNATFVPSHDLLLKEKVGLRPGEERRDDPITSGYLTWP